jgi:hypothetical protein
MRRWNGWGEEAFTCPLPEAAAQYPGTRFGAPAELSIRQSCGCQA